LRNRGRSKLMKELHHFVSTEHQWKDEYPGPSFSMSGDVSGLYGDCTYIGGDCTGITGDCTGITGIYSNIIGSLTEAFPVERRTRYHISACDYATKVEVNG
jgi:hypothetical protein